MDKKKRKCLELSTKPCVQKQSKENERTQKVISCWGQRLAKRADFVAEVCPGKRERNQKTTMPPNERCEKQFKVARHARSFRIGASGGPAKRPRNQKKNCFLLSLVFLMPSLASSIAFSCLLFFCCRLFASVRLCFLLLPCVSFFCLLLPSSVLFLLLVPSSSFLDFCFSLLPSVLFCCPPSLAT